MDAGGRVTQEAKAEAVTEERSDAAISGSAKSEVATIASQFRVESINPQLN